MGLAHSQVVVPPLKARVTDLTGTLTQQQLQTLEQNLAAFEARKGSQIAVLIVPTVKPESIEQYSIRVVEAWKLGRKKIDDGVLFLIAKNDREMRIEVGYGLEGALPDITASRIITEVVTPLFKQGDFYGGINAGVERIIRVIDGEALPEPVASASTGRGDRSNLFFMAFILIFVFGGILRSMFGRFMGATVASGVAGFAAWTILSSIGLALLLGFFAFLFTLVGGGRGGGLGGSGFGGGGYGGGGGSGGGFSGGGGGFGGGGASGRW